MDSVVAGIDVARAGLDVHALPASRAFAVSPRQFGSARQPVVQLQKLAPRAAPSPEEQKSRRHPA